MTENQLKKMYKAYYRHTKRRQTGRHFKTHCALKCLAIEGELTNRYGVPAAVSYIKAWEREQDYADIPF